MEASALHRCRLAIYTSEWAAESAVRDYGVDAGRVAVVPFGANLETQVLLEEARAAIAKRPRDTCRLVFIGVEWQRKGGPLAVAIADALNRGGLKTELDIVGHEPDGRKLPSFVNSLGFISKGTRAGQDELKTAPAQSPLPGASFTRRLHPGRAERSQRARCSRSHDKRRRYSDRRSERREWEVVLASRRGRRVRHLRG